MLFFPSKHRTIELILLHLGRYNLPIRRSWGLIRNSDVSIHIFIQVENTRSHLHCTQHIGCGELCIDSELPALSVEASPGRLAEAYSASQQFFGLYVMERFGRRNPLIIGGISFESRYRLAHTNLSPLGIWQSAWLFVFAAAGVAKDPTENKGIGNRECCRFNISLATWPTNSLSSDDCVGLYVHCGLRRDMGASVRFSSSSCPHRY